MSDEPDRKHFLDKFLQFQEERGSALTQVPTISKIPLDLFRLYLSVKERGGFVEVTRAKIWKECANICNIANSSSAAYTLRKQYMKHLLPFECKFDRGGIDPGPVLSQLDAANASNRKKSTAKSGSNANQSTPSTTPRLSPSDQAGQAPYHSMPPSGPGGAPHPGPYSDMEQQQSGGYPPNTTAPPGGPHGGPPYHQMHGQAPYALHPEYGQFPGPGGPHGGPPGGHMGPPPTPGSQQQQQQQQQHSSESISVKDPFADDDSSSNPSPVPSSAASNFPGRSHFSMPPGSQGKGYTRSLAAHCCVIVLIVSLFLTPNRTILRTAAAITSCRTRQLWARVG